MTWNPLNSWKSIHGDVKPDICFYHAHCPDGFTAAWAVRKAFGDACQYVPLNYGEELPRFINASHRVVFVDFSLKREAMRELAAHVSVTVYDHHKTAEAELAPLLGDGTISGVFYMGYSGARLAWLAFHDAPIPALVRYIEDRDLWKHALPDTKEVNAWISSYKPTWDTWDEISRYLAQSTLAAVAEGSAIVRSNTRAIEGYLKNARPMKIGGFIVPVVNCPKYHSSELGHALCAINRASEVDGSITKPPFSATYYDFPDRREFSLRSTDDQEDVSAIAAALGGGGHRNAAGFSIPLECSATFGLL